MTLNNGTIESLDGNGNNTPGTLSATDSFNLANGTIEAGVTLAGTASLNKRTTGTVTIDGAVASSVSVFVDQGDYRPRRARYNRTDASLLGSRHQSVGME